LRHVRAENFRAFRHAEITLPQDGLVLVAGANNSGKTALLSAFDVIAGDSGDIMSLQHAGQDAPASVTATFALADDEKLVVLASAQSRDQLLADGAAASLEFLFMESPEPQRAAGLAGLGLTEIRGDWPGHGMVPLALARWEEAGISHLSRAAALTGGERDALEMTDRGGVGGSLWLDQLTHWPDLPSFGQLLVGWRSRFYHFRALRTGTERSQPLTSPAKLEPTGSNLAGVLHYLATDRPSAFRRLGDVITEIVPALGRLQVRTGGDRMRVVFEDSQGDRNLKDLGTGVEQLLMTLLVGLTEDSPFTLVIEEPETNLHPAAQRALLGHFLSWADDRQIIAATHSPVMLNWSPGGDRLWHVTRDGDGSHVALVDADPLPLLSSLGVQLSDVLSADRVLVLEGPSDQDVLTIWFPEVLRSPRVAVLSGQGGDNARHAGRLAEWLAGTDRVGLRRVLYLRDRDELPAGALEKLSRSPTVHILARRELENYLLDPAALATVLGALLPPGTEAPPSADVATVIDEAAWGLRQKIIVNRVCRQVGPARPLMDHAIRQDLASAGADADQVTTAVLERLITADDLRAQIAGAWAEAERDVASQEGAELLAIAPGEEILEAVFQRFAGRRYDKRRDGPAIAKAMNPPQEIKDLLTAFMSA